MNRPRVVLFGAEGTLAGLDDALATFGISLVTYPLLAFDEPADWSPVDQAIGSIAEYAAIAVTSPRASAAFARRLQARTARIGAVPPVWATGAASAAALHAMGFRCEVGEGGNQFEGAAAQLADRMIEAEVGSPVLFLCGQRHRPDLTDRLRGAGVVVYPIICYRTEVARPGRVNAVLPGAAAVIVTSPSAVEALGAALGGHPPAPPVIALGATTLAAAHAAGWPSVSAAASPTPVAVAGWVGRVLGQTVSPEPFA